MSTRNLVTETDLARDAIIQGETSRCISLMLRTIKQLDSSQSKELYNDLCVFSSNFSQIKRDRQLGTISSEIFAKESNRINQALLEAINEIEIQIQAGSGTLKIIDSDDSFGIPRNAVPDKFYFGFLIFGMSMGLGLSVVFMNMFYGYLLQDTDNYKQLLFIAAVGIASAMFLSGALDGFNRSKSRLVDWRIVLPFLVAFVGCLVAAGVLTLVG